MSEDQINKPAEFQGPEPMRLRQLRESLDAAKVKYVIHAHDLHIKSSRDGVEQGFGELAKMAPTLILRAGEDYLTAIIRADTRVSYKMIKQKLKLKDISLASPEQVFNVTGSEVGYVSLLNPGLTTIMDGRLTEMDTIFGGCGVPYYTLEINPTDLAVLVRAQVFDFTEPKG